MKYNEKALDDFNKLCDIAEKDTGGDQLAATITLNASGQIQYLAGTNTLNNGVTGNAVSKSYFYKAKALKKLNNCNDAILYFEQVIRMCDDQFLQSSALYEIAKIKI